MNQVIKDLLVNQIPGVSQARALKDVKEAEGLEKLVEALDLAPINPVKLGRGMKERIAARRAARRAAEREEDNSTLAKFIRNLESRIYAQMAKQLVESMFSNDGSVRFGSFILEGNTVTYEVITNEDGSEFIRMTIVGSDGTETVIEIPIGTGNFGQDPDGSG